MKTITLMAVDYNSENEWLQAKRDASNLYSISQSINGGIKYWKNIEDYTEWKNAEIQYYEWKQKTA